MREVTIKSYTRKTKSGKTITVKGHTRKGKDAKHKADEKAGEELKAKREEYQKGLRKIDPETKRAWVEYERRRKVLSEKGMLHQGADSHDRDVKAYKKLTQKPPVTKTQKKPSKVEGAYGFFDKLIKKYGGKGFKKYF